MFDLEKCIDDQLRRVNKLKPTVIFPEGDDPRVLEAASRLTTFANVVLVADKAQVAEQLSKGLDLEGSVRRFEERVRIIAPDGSDMPDEVLDQMAHRLAERSRGHHWEMSIQEAQRKVREPIHLSILLVAFGYADAVLGGLRNTSRDFFLPCLRLLPKDRTVFEMALFALPDEHPPGVYEQNLVMFADVALNPEPSAEALADIAVGACRTMREIIPPEVLPRINGALLSYSTRGSGEGPSVQRIRTAEPMIQEKLARLAESDPLYASISIEVELQVSVALSEQAARTKLDTDHHPVAGKSNVLIAPYLDVGNMLYHLYSVRFPEAKAVLMIGGLGAKALDFSRQSTSDEIVLGAKALLVQLLRSPEYHWTRLDFFFPRYQVLAINPGSTSTKVALFQGEEEIARKEITHGDLPKFGSLDEQLPARLGAVTEFLAEQHVGLTDMDALVGRGGLILPVPSGTYRICDRMLDDLRREVAGRHASNLGAIIASELASKAGCPAFVVDPPVVDELDDTSRITGLEESEQEAAWHALSQKAAAKLYADQYGKDYEELNLIVAHLGGGISVGCHRKGRCVRVRNALYDGPMSPNRAGTLPGGDLIDLCYSGLSRAELESKLIGNGGLVSYLGTDDLREVERRIEAGDEQAAVVYQAMCEQIAAEIASGLPKFHGEPVDRIIVTGGMAHSARLRRTLVEDLSQLDVPITFYPGEREMEALRDGALRVLRGFEPAKDYEPIRDKL